MDFLLEILINALRYWKSDYQMVKFTYDQQIEAYNALQTIESTVREDLCVMEDLRTRYNDLLAIMREGYTAEDGSELTFDSEDFTGRIIGLMCLFYEDGPVGETNFSDIAWDWKWDHYNKVLAELTNLGVVDGEGNLDPAECHQVKIEMESIQEGEYFV